MGTDCVGKTLLSAANMICLGNIPTSLLRDRQSSSLTTVIEIYPGGGGDRRLFTTLTPAFDLHLSRQPR
jgi:hypothetical protein